MPELPEVQTIVSDLKIKIIGRKIIDFWSDTPKLIKSSSFDVFRRKIKGFIIDDIKRIGKNILFYLKRNNKEGSSFVLLAHQKMTGHFMVGKWDVIKIGGKSFVKNKIRGDFDDPRNQYVRAIFYLDDGKMLALSDLRKFAKIFLGKKDEVENLKEIKYLGVDALLPSFSLEYFKKLLKKTSRPIKSILLDQKFVSGVGNIYADESLFLSKISPFLKGNKLSSVQIERLVNAIKKILKKAIKMRGTSIIDFRDADGKRGLYDKARLVYGREGMCCRVCDGTIERKKIGQRSSYFCRNCQFISEIKNPKQHKLN